MRIRLHPKVLAAKGGENSSWRDLSFIAGGKREHIMLACVGIFSAKNYQRFRMATIILLCVSSISSDLHLHEEGDPTGASSWSKAVPSQ